MPTKNQASNKAAQATLNSMLPNANFNDRPREKWNMMGKYFILEYSPSIDLDDFDYKLNVYWEEDETYQFYATFALDKPGGGNTHKSE